MGGQGRSKRGHVRAGGIRVRVGPRDRDGRVVVVVLAIGRGVGVGRRMGRIVGAGRRAVVAGLGGDAGGRTLESGQRAHLQQQSTVQQSGLVLLRLSSQTGD